MRGVAVAMEAATRGLDVCYTRFPLGWNGAYTHFRHPLDYIGHDGGAGVGSGPGMTVGAGLALKGTGRMPIALMGDGDFLMGNTAVWTAAHYGIPCLMVVCNNRSFYNDERHQGRMAEARGRPVENRWIGQRIADPDIDIAGMARMQGAAGIGPVDDPAKLQGAIEEAIATVQSGKPCVVDARVLPGYDNRSMKVVTRFPHAYTETEDCWIPMPDGVRLAAKLWLPDIASQKRVPTIIEVIPYRKRDIYAPRDAMHHRYFAGHGYATMRVDIRGSGDSDGLQGVFATNDESEDTVQVLKWIAQQPWSDGQVAMFGISWGGFQGIQTAHRAPKELKAVIAQSYAPDRYRYSQVYRGGCVLLRSIRWSSQVFGYKSRPPDPELVGDRWREMWMARLENNTPQIVSALKHQTFDRYWRERGIDHDRIKVPFFAVSGWADGAYVGSVSESLGKLKVPSKGLIGPWGHRYAHLGMPGPAIGFLQEALRWYDHWMRGKATGVSDDPRLIAWMPRAVPAKAFYAESPGRWVSEDEWPSRRIRTQRFFLERRTARSARGRAGEQGRRGNRRRRSALRAAS